MNTDKSFAITETSKPSYLDLVYLDLVCVCVNVYVYINVLYPTEG